MFDYIIKPSRANPTDRQGAGQSGKEGMMILIFALMVMMLVADALSDWMIGVLRRAREPRGPIVRARRYRFN
jgi:hypothetical protein